MLQIYLIPILGLLKNYVKYKKISINLFFRTPIICYLIKYVYYFFLKKNLHINQIIIYERYLMFFYKILYSIINNNYKKKKEKYIKKYNIIY